MIKNRTPDGVKQGIFKLIVNEQAINLACEVCFAVDAENPSFYRAAFTDDTCSHINLYCSQCGIEQQQDVEDCPAPFMIQPESEVSNAQET